MEKENTNIKIWNIFKRGDIIKCPEVWGQAKFEIVGFDGNWYCPILCVIACSITMPSGKPMRCNIGVGQAKLVNSSTRPFKNMNHKGLLILVSKKNIEAKRELKIRINLKK